MQAYLYQYNGPQNKIVKDWTTVFNSPSFIYKKPTDEYNPDLEFVGDLSDLRKYNYVGIQGDGLLMVYRIESWESFRNNVCIAHCTLDTLTTYQDAILSSSALVKRSENSYNLWFRDPAVDTYAYKTVDSLHIATMPKNDNYIAVIVGD